MLHIEVQLIRGSTITNKHATSGIDMMLYVCTLRVVCLILYEAMRKEQVCRINCSPEAAFVAFS